ncbi:hypothetical protein CBA19CS22_12385 [Caballeronia novacaledonica]|uniref:Uncharacterized protein n=1 Tax=Caballeronia novacaledonica TaxID=1544861 RepID=A0ACB5QQY5_9BURK|nr:MULTISPECIES: hypothetical protein [Caballeronia]MDR5747847.1 hypothetical protein [Caballeronia sp. LZ029]GJH13708.1 hypothetical protein CBA19CS11_32740 [Caballeronia novacaledonica]GJH17341.1 hypothetical protein CBA19CS22_12385 [Caballeronia novacaledonica]
MLQAVIAAVSARLESGENELSSRSFLKIVVPAMSQAETMHLNRLRQL